MEKTLNVKCFLGNIFLTKGEVSTNLNIDVLYVLTSLQNNRARILKSSILEKMHPGDTNVFASNIIDKYKNQPDNLHSMWLADFASSYVSKKAEDLPIEPDEIKRHTVPVSSIYDVKLSPNTIVLKNEFGKMQKHSQPFVIHFHKVFKLKSPEEHYLRLLHLYMSWRNENELKQDNDEEDNAEFSLINSILPDLDLEDSNSVSNVPDVSTIIYNLLLPNEKFYEICSQLNEGQQHLLNFIMQYALHCKLAEKNNELLPKLFQIFFEWRCWHWKKLFNQGSN